MSTVPSLLTLALSPIIISLSLFLIPLAFFTTFIAFSALAIRVMAIYIELFTALLFDHVRNVSSNSRKPTRFAPQRSRSSASSSSGARTPRLSNSMYATNPGAMDRDFEGIGGWREPSADEENEKQWLNINSRLELPALPPSRDERRRRHHRTLTSGSSASEKMAFVAPDGRRSRPKSAIVLGDSSPEEEFGGDAGTKSLVALGDAGMNIGKVRSYWRRESSGSSTNGMAISMPTKAAG